MEDLISKLNAGTKEERLEAVRALRLCADEGRLAIPVPDGNTNNHIHTTFSFSPYSPTKAVFAACMSGLSAAGIIDHDSVGGIPEFREAGRIMGMPTTAGFELRAGFGETPFENRTLNNPDQPGVAYMTVHGLADSKRAIAEDFLKPVGEARGKRNIRMCERLAEVAGIGINYEKDVVPLSEKLHGGSVTERHILCALSLKLIEKHGRGQALAERLKMYPTIDSRAVEGLAEPDEGLFLYDLIGVLKAGFIESFYVPAGVEECPNVRELVVFAAASDSVLAYAYLGDIENSVTGDKKAQAFEDGYLDELFEALDGLGIRAVTYMPPRNTRAQLLRVRALCEKYGMLQISGEDINSPRQRFISEASKDPLFSNLRETTELLISHERAIDKGSE